MASLYIDSIAIAVLLIAAGWAFWLALISGFVGAWGLLGSGLTLLGAWHLRTLLEQGITDGPHSVSAAVPTLAVSLFLLAGIVLLTPLARRLARDAQDIREREQKFQGVFNTTIDGIVVTDHKGIIESFNPAAEKIFGYRADEVIGLNVSILLPSTQEEHHDGHIDHYHKTGEQWVLGARRDVLARHKDGREISIALALNEMGTGRKSCFVATIHDISKMLLIEDRLAESGRLLQTVLDTIPVAVFWKDIKGRYVGGNKVFARDVGVDSPDQFFGLRDADMPWAERTAHVARIEKTIISSGEARLGMEEPWADSDGENRWLHTSRVPLRDKSGDIIGVLGLYEDITDEFRFREALLLEKQRVERYLDVSGAMVVEVDASGCVALINRKGLEILGYAENELIGRDWFDAVVPPEQQERMRDAFIRQVSRDAKPYAAIEGEVITKEGERRFIAWQISFDVSTSGPMTKVVGSGVDVTHMRRTDRMLRVAVESLNDGFALFDADDRLVLFNTVYTKYFPIAGPFMQHGRSYEEIIRYGAIHGQFGDLGDGLEAFIQGQLAAHQNPTGPREILTGEGRWIRADERRTDDGGIVGTRTDITDLKKATEAAETANAAKSQFLSSMSHELRTPLNAILGFAQLLEDDPKNPLNDSQSDDVKQIIHSARHLMGLVGEVLDLARVESGRLKLDMKLIPIQPAMKQVLSLIRPLADHRGITLEAKIDAAAAKVWADEGRLRQVLINLISNAIKYNADDGHISVTLTVTEEGKCCLSVTDTGQGIPLEKQGQMFEPFNRLGAATSAIEGTGIGLNITKRLVELMGGGIGFSSVPGEGSTFWVMLMMSEPRSEAPERQKTILYVDDNAANHQFMAVALQGVANVTVVAAGSLEEGIKSSAEAQPDAIIYDHAMGGSEGARALRSAPALKGVPLIGIGDHLDKGARSSTPCTDGCDVCLSRPLRQMDLKDAFDRVFDGI